MGAGGFFVGGLSAGGQDNVMLNWDECGVFGIQ